MPQKERSGTTLSKSGTSNRVVSSSLNLDTPLQYLKGVGPKLALLFESKGVSTIRDALFYFPRDYQDRSTLRPISSVRVNETVLIRGQVTGYAFIPMRMRKRPLLEAYVSDGTGLLSLKWFQYNRTFLETKLKAKPSLIAYGSVSQFGSRLGMVHPDIEWDAETSDASANERILPVYSETEGLHQKTLRKVILQALDAGLPLLVDDLPETVRQQHGLAELKKAVKALHYPERGVSIEDLRAFNTTEQRRMIFDEFFKFEWVVGRRRLQVRRENTKPYPKEASARLFEDLKKRIPFEMTQDQQTSIEKIFDDLSQDKPMNRLLQGDVGCGKTLVALSSALPVVASGGQVALMAPTEILAEQHLVNARKYLEGLALPDGAILSATLLSGSTPRSEREKILEGLNTRKIQLLIGTHALIEDPVRFAELGLVIIDEQHRFGVDQRMLLRAKGNNPHVLSLTATPIPRTLALTAYGDLDVSTIKQMPKGRPEIHTQIVKKDERSATLDLLKRELTKGRQAYIIYPLVEESEKIDLANAISAAEELANGPLKDFRVGLLHGRLKPQEKSAVMESFKRGETHALVSTTVVEVGVDVPNATVLIIEHAERFGLSQLHQLRGRVGRGTETSYCFLVTAGGGAAAPSFERLRAMERTRDGFKLAELDLQIRGPGEFLGTRQSGELQFRFASLVRDQFILQEARKAAFELLMHDPELERPEHAPLRAYMQRRGQMQQKRFETA
ncbi:MAG: ATP-dependent DNA helicase RecG [Bdellovibrionota bacterium]